MIFPDSVNDDPVIHEIRQIRGDYSVRFHGDLRAIVAEMNRQHANDGSPEITRSPKRILKSAEPKSPAIP